MEDDTGGLSVILTVWLRLKDIGHSGDLEKGKGRQSLPDHVTWLNGVSCPEKKILETTSGIKSEYRFLMWSDDIEEA